MSDDVDPLPKGEPLRAWLLLFCKGMAMGAADVVPGVSGGTIAFITGIYERLLNALKQAHPLTLKLWFKQGFSVFWQTIDGYFLLVLFAGILVSILSLANIIHYMLEHYAIVLSAFFFGLVLASVIFLIRQIPRFQWQYLLLLALGTGVAVVISVMRPAELPDSWWMMFIAGFIAICAMILPGISGSFILLLMGMYRVVIEAVTTFNIFLLTCFSLGCLLGLVIFSHILSLLLKRYFSGMLSLLSGFLLGSLSVLWPWKQILETTVNRHGEVVPLLQKNVLPTVYTQITSHDSQMFFAFFVFCVGFLIVFSMESVMRRSHTE